MKKIALIFVALLATMAMMPEPEASPIFSIGNGGIINVNNQYINPADTRSALPTNYTSEASTSLVVGTATYDIRFGNEMNITSNFEGDYDVIEFYKNNHRMLLYRCSNYIIKYANTRIGSNLYDNAPSLRNSPAADNDYFISVDLSPTAKAIVFMGLSIPTNLSELTIFVLTETDVKLVLRKELEALTTIKERNEFKMLVQSNIQYVIDEATMELSPPVAHEIFLENGVLKFRDVPTSATQQ